MSIINFVSRMSNFYFEQYVTVASILEMIQHLVIYKKWPQFFTSLPWKLARALLPRAGRTAPALNACTQPFDLL